MQQLPTSTLFSHAMRSGPLQFGKNGGHEKSQYQKPLTQGDYTLKPLHTDCKTIGIIGPKNLCKTVGVIGKTTSSADFDRIPIDLTRTKDFRTKERETRSQREEDLTDGCDGVEDALHLSPILFLSSSFPHQIRSTMMSPHQTMPFSSRWLTSPPSSPSGAPPSITCAGVPRPPTRR